MTRLAFFGTPDIAVSALNACLESDNDVVLVVSQPDRPRGRGQKLEPTPVKARAVDANVQVAQPETLKKGTESGDAFLTLFKELNIDLAVVMAYGRIIPQRILDVPRRGFVNVHASLLPRWRGAAPIHRAIEHGDVVTGVCLMHMVLALDAGGVYSRLQIAIANDDDADTLTTKLAALSHEILVRDLDAIVDDKLSIVPQPDDGVTYASMLTKAEGVIDFAKSAAAVSAHVRAMTPWPGASTTLDGEVLKLFAPTVHAGRTGAPGVVIAADDVLTVGTGDGAVSFVDVQAPSKRRMSVRDFVRGRPIKPGTVLGT